MGFRACCIGIVEDGGNAVAGCFAELDIALDDCLEYEFAEVALHLFVDLVCQSQTTIIHSQEEALNLEAGIHACLDYLYGVEQLADAFQSEVLSFDCDDDTVSFGQGVHCDEAKAGTAVDEDVVVILDDGLQQVPHHLLLVLEVQQFYFGSDQVDV